ncbi:DUF2497 domain-containing protein [Maricaulis sp. D1M11]|uniref:DUF2497 domain-containing protein n=1 Tax=Maricaulis sp. D1M11 TaxID=3076117 RepID=UPI0039B4C797
MAEQSADSEPSMEEILSSIRRIINEDEDEAPAEAAADEDLGQDAVDNMFDEPAEPEPAPEPADDVLELTEKVDEDEGISVADDLMILDREDEEAEPEPEPMAAFEEEITEGIMSDGAATAAMGSFHQLADTIRISEEEGRTLEGVVRALLRPMLKEWLDANLPGIVDEKVQAEIDRVARRRR